MKMTMKKRINLLKEIGRPLLRGTKDVGERMDIILRLMFGILYVSKTKNFRGEMGTLKVTYTRPKKR